jgi:hypothetical protein
MITLLHHACDCGEAHEVMCFGRSKWVCLEKRYDSVP